MSTTSPPSIGRRRDRVIVLAVIGLFSLYLASLDWEERGAFGAPLPLGALLSAFLGLIVWSATSSRPRLRWCGRAAVTICLAAVMCSAIAWWLWLTEWVPAGYPGHDPAANARVDLWLARADYSYFVAFVGAAVLVVATTIGAKRGGTAVMDNRQPSGGSGRSV